VQLAQGGLLAGHRGALFVVLLRVLAILALLRVDASFEGRFTLTI
jgi:hypothetical protein